MIRERCHHPTRRSWRLLVVFLFLFFSAMGMKDPIRAEEMAESDPEQVHLEVRLSGLETLPEIEAEARTLLALERGDEPQPIPRFRLTRHLKQERKKLIDLLKSHGYFDVEAEARLVEQPDRAEIALHVTPHTGYRLATPQLRITPTDARFTPPSWQQLRLTAGAPAASQRIIQAENDLLTSARAQGFPRARIAKRQVVRQRATQEIAVTYHMETGPKVRLGEVVLKGAPGVDPFFLKRRIPWNRGTLFHPKHLEETRQALTTTGLFSMVRIRLADTPDERQLWPVEVELTERKARTWRAGGGFSTDRGIVVNGGWEHRNIHQGGERLRTEANFGVKTQTLSGSFTIPDYAQRGQQLRFLGTMDNSSEEAFENTALDLAATLIRPVLAPGGEGSLTIDYRLSRVRTLSTNQEATYSILSLPLAITLDRSNDLLDPTSGWRLTTELAPHIVVTGSGSPFIRLNHKISRYQPWPDHPDWVMAVRAELDSTWGAKQNNIPADTLLYAGGGSSVRGYGQQMAGTVDNTGKPLGGLSVLALGAEVRHKLTDTMGIVGFVDTGRAFDSPWPTRLSDLFTGIGSGIRYQTPVGPLRLDIGMPLERRAGIDGAWQLYMSIGQAF
ncbi:MAG: outer membrane protein assembly factor [Magnetococcales bacterium]|nr:outer membrane protein assembly factor [Magnetococcales bacterium]